MGNFNHATHLQILPGTGNRGPHSKERYFLDIRNKYKWMLEMGAERVLLYKRKWSGTRCPLYDKVRRRSQRHGQDTICFGTGWVGGYFKPVEIASSLITGGIEQAVIEDWGRRRIYNTRSWTLWEPLLQNGDFIVRRNNQRLWITSTYQRRWKHFVTRQDFETKEVDRGDPIYKIPV